VDAITAKELCVVFTILQVLDVWTTHRILSAGGRELNPVMDWLFKRLGVLPGLIIVKTVVVALIWFYLISHPVFVAALCIFYVAVVIHNFKSI